MTSVVAPSTSVTVTPSPVQAITVSTPAIQVAASAPSTTTVNTQSQQMVDVQELGILGPAGPAGPAGPPGATLMYAFDYIEPYDPPETVVGAMAGQHWLNEVTGIVFTLEG